MEVAVDGHQLSRKLAFHKNGGRRGDPAVVLFVEEDELDFREN